MTKVNQAQIPTSLTSKSTAEEIRAILTCIAKEALEPIMLEQQLRTVAVAVKTSLKAVRHNYEIVLKNLNLKPIDLGLSIAKHLLNSKYGEGTFLKMGKDGFYFAYSGTCWSRIYEGKIRAELQEISVEYKHLTDKTLHSLVSDAMGSLRDYLGTNQDVLTLGEEPCSIFGCKICFASNTRKRLAMYLILWGHDYGL